MIRRKEALSIVVAVITAFATIVAAVITAASAAGAYRPSKDCIDIYDRYAAEIAKGPQWREAVLPGKDGRSLVDSDPEARACKISHQDFPVG